MGMLNRKIYKGHKLGDRVKPVCVTGHEGGAKQEFAAESDINVIMKRYLATGHLPVRDVAPTFADVSKIGDYADVLRRVTAAEEAFASLSPELRFRFGNRAERLMDFIHESSNREEAIKLGLIDAPPVPPGPAIIDAAKPIPKGKAKPPKQEEQEDSDD